MADLETGDLLERIDALENRNRRADPRAGMETVMWAVMRNLFPQETRRHMKAAGREQLLAARSYLDHWISKMGDAADDDAADDDMVTRETIEVE